jgi:hypothetical protein
MHAWLAADKFCMPEFQNALIDVIMAYWTKWCIPPREFAWVLDNVDKNSQLYRLARDTLAWDISADPQHYQPDESDLLGWSAQLDEIFHRPELSIHELLWRSLMVQSLTNEDEKPTKRGQAYHVHQGKKPAQSEE